MINKRLLAFLAAFALFIGVGSVAFASSKISDAGSDKEFGNLSNALLCGGYAADYADGMVLFSDSDNNGYLTLKNISSGNTRIISEEKASYINVIGRNIYYIADRGNGSCIVRTTLNNEREMLVSSENRISNLFVSSDEMYYLSGSDAVRYDFETKKASVVYSNPGMEAFIPDENGIYWLKEKPSDSESHREYSTCSAKPYEGTEDEQINYDCYFYRSLFGRSTESSLANTFRIAEADNSELSSLALTARVGDVSLPGSEFPVGSYFTDNGEGCTDHGTGSCGWETEKLCNCKAFHNGVALNSVQCYAYARYNYYLCFGEIGTLSSKTSSNLGTISKGYVTEENFKHLISQTKPGAHLRVQYIKADGVTLSTHSMIILDWNREGFSVLESNTDGKCGVRVRRIAYRNYVPTLISVDFLMMPDEYPSASEEETTAPDISEPSTEESSTVTESRVSTETDATQIESDSSTVASTIEENTSFFYQILVTVSEKILGFFAWIVELLVSIL